MPGSAAGRIAPPASGASVAPLEPLSEREREVLRLVAAGLPNREIAERLIVAEGTIKTHLHNICGKLGAANRVQAIARARELRLI
jgi:ATP/maltotriose-dependent transcriptional regulator MalT